MVFFSNQKSKFFEGLLMDDVGILYGHLVYFIAIGYILVAFGIFKCDLVYFSRFGMLFQEKSGNPEEKEKLANQKSERINLRGVKSTDS
jgi:hypothetical protein